MASGSGATRVATAGEGIGAGPLFEAQVYRDRVRRAAELTRAAELDALVVAPGPDLRYLIGSRAETFERLTALVIPATSDPRLVIARLEVPSLSSSAVGDLDIEVADWVDGDDAHALALAGLPSQPRIAVSDSMPALHVIPLARHTGATPQLATDVLRELRMIKDAAEIDALRSELRARAEGSGGRTAKASKRASGSGRTSAPTNTRSAAPGKASGARTAKPRATSRTTPG